MVAHTETGLSAQGHVLDTSGKCFGKLRSSSDIADDTRALGERMEEDGYLYIPGFWHRDKILEVRADLLENLSTLGVVDPDFPLMEGRSNPEIRSSFKPEAARNLPSIRKLLFSGKIIDFWSAFFGEKVRHFDFVWLRAISRGKAAPPHCDIVYMGRGTHRLHTCWVPYGDISLDIGGVMVLEGSHRQTHRFSKYLKHDVDTYCVNGRHAGDIESGKRVWERDGNLSRNPVSLREKLGGRWLTAEFRMGDLLTFGMHTVHASLDNRSPFLRLSSDTRYQRASEPVDMRWVGSNPPGHSMAGKKGRVC